MKTFFFTLLLFCFFLPIFTNAQTTFAPEQIISTNVDYATSVYAIDLDSDGDNDVLSASFDDDKIAWYENNGSGNFSAEQIISTNADGARAVYAIDIDGDGDNDVLSVSAYDDKIAWYKNNGSGNFSTEQLISTNADGAWSVYAIDLDGDGDNDVLSASINDNKIAWYENLLYAVGVPAINNGTNTATSVVVCTLANNLSTPNTLQIQFNAPQTEPTKVQVYDVMGHLINSQTFNATKGINTWQMEVANYPTGMYLVQVSNQSITQTAKIVNGK